MAYKILFLIVSSKRVISCATSEIFDLSDLILVSDRTYGLFLLNFEKPPNVSEEPYFLFPNPAQNYIYFYKEHMGLANYTLNIFSSLGVLFDQFYVNKEYQRIDLSKYSTRMS